MRLEVKINGNWVDVGDISIKFVSEEKAEEFALKLVMDWLNR